ncbi:SRPBCC family protein [Nocardia fluminea]|uniref:SRPBCC family protein n=1 Tax=Nocardia fluminea TaxID=134984 RepID=UPI003437C02D
MSYIEKAKEQLTDLVGKAVFSSSSGGGAQTVTISRPQAEVEPFWRDPEKLSQVLGDLAEVRSTGPRSYEWVLHSADEESITWDTTLETEEDGLRFVGATDSGDPAGAVEIRVTFRVGPRDLGTEVTLRVKSPVPDLLTGPATFKVLYRARALLQTGELPTLAHNPSARAAAH